MTTGQSTFSDAVRQAERSFTAPGFSTLTENLKRITVLRRAVRNAGGDPVGTSFPGPGDQPAVIAALETQLRNLLDAANISAQYNESLIESSGPEIDIQDDPRLLATEGGLPPQDPAPQSGSESQISSLQRRKTKAFSDAESALGDSAGFQTLNRNQQIVTIVRRAIIDAGGVPIGPEFPSIHEADRVIAALYKQLKTILSASNLAGEYRESYIESNTPEISIANDPRLITTEGGDQPQAASVPNGDTAIRDRAYNLQRELRSLGVTPVINGPISIRDAAVAVTRLNNQLNALLNPERETVIAPEEFSSGASTAQLPVDDGFLFVSQDDIAPGVAPARRAQIETLRERIRAAGDRPEFTGTITPDNVFRAVRELSAQLERLLAVQRAKSELEDSATALDVLDPRETQIMALQQAIRDYGEVPVVRGEVRPDSYTSAIISLDRQLKEITSRTEGFNQQGQNTDPYSTDAASDVFASRSSEIGGQSGATTVVEAYREIKDYFAPGELDALMIGLLTDRGFNELSTAEQTFLFLNEVDIKAGLINFRPGHLTSDQTEINRLINKFESAYRANGTLKFRDLGTLGFKEFFDAIGTQIVPDSIAEDLPDPIRIPVQAALNLTAPINFVLLFTGGVGLANVGKAILGEIIGGVLGQVAADQGAPVWAQMLLEIGGGILGGDVIPDLATSGNRAARRSTAELLDELGEIPGDKDKFVQLLQEGKLKEAFEAATLNVIDDVGDVAAAAEMRKFFDDIAKGAAKEGLTDLDYMLKEIAVASVGELIESYDRPERGSQLSTRNREPFPFRLVISDQMVNYLTTRVTEGGGLDDIQRENSLAGIDKFLEGVEPTIDEYDALESAFGRDFVLSISKAASDGILRSNESGIRPLPSPEEPEFDPRKTFETSEAVVYHMYYGMGLTESQLNLLSNAYYKLVNGVPVTEEDRVAIRAQLGPGYIEGLEARFRPPSF